VKALTAFPSVLGNMDKNLSWASSLGDAYFNQQPDVMDAVQVMRHRAQAAGDLKTTSQQNVTTKTRRFRFSLPTGDRLCPAYNPWLAYGDPIMAWPGWYPYPGIWFGGPYLSWVAASESAGSEVMDGLEPLGFNWGADMRCTVAAGTTLGATRFITAAISTGQEAHAVVTVCGAPRLASLYREQATNGNFAGRGGAFNRPGATARPFNGNTKAARGYAAPRGQSGVRSGAFSGYDHGGQARSYSSRGSASMGTAHASGGSRSAGGGSHGGGGHSGGGHR